MKIGIGVCTTPKRKQITKKENYLKYTSYGDVYIIINNDINQIGAPSSRNFCIKSMMDEGCDYMFLFDDACYPIMYGFDKYIVDEAVKNDLHFLTCPQIFKDKLYDINDEVTFWSGCVGMFSFFTRKHIETIGYYNTEYEKYGFTDPPYTYRSKLSPLSKSKLYHTSLLRIPFYIKSEDIYHLNPIENYSMDEKRIFINKNRKVYKEEKEEAAEGKLFYTYSQKHV